MIRLFSFFICLIFCSLAVESAENVLGKKLIKCSDSPVTGFNRTGYCTTDALDNGTHVVCATVTKKFLDYTKSKGNDLSTPKPQYQFPGLVPGNKWCLCALRWNEANAAGVAPLVHLESTDKKVLEFVSLDSLKKPIRTSNLND